MIVQPTLALGPRGSRVLVDSAGDIPLVCLRLAIPGGAAADPDGAEGFSHHAFSLARRGAGDRDREALDAALDQLGATLEIHVDRDAAFVTAVCLSRHVDAVVGLIADVLARPHLSDDEHERLIRETGNHLDDLRADDSALAARFFARHLLPGHPYSRSVWGTEATLARFAVADARALHRQSAVADGLVIGFAGDVDESRADELAAQLIADLSAGPAPSLAAVRVADDAADGDPKATWLPARGRRLVLVDKPERSQSQIAIGHLGPPEAAADPALMVVEAAFGGMFTSRLMQAIRVERGWSYGAECVVAPTRGASWTRIHLAPPVEVTPDAVALTLSMFEDVAARGITDDELVQAKSYLVGSLPFQQATARQRVTRALRHHIYGWTPQQLATLPTQLAAVTADQARDAAARWLRPDDALIAVVATADEMVPRLAALGVCDERSVEVVDYDSY